jgi:hypothetical protein
MIFIINSEGGTPFLSCQLPAPLTLCKRIGGLVLVIVSKTNYKVIIPQKNKKTRVFDKFVINFLFLHTILW